LPAAAIAAVPARLAEVAQTVREAGGRIVSTHFTLVPGKGGEPLIAEHLKRLKPFLGAGDFAPGSFRPRHRRRARSGGPQGRGGGL
jgi:hypothetical protein